jgi:hypothetical protein
VVVGALVGMGALLLAAAVLSAGSMFLLHGAYREAQRELRDGDRRLEPGAGPGRRLDDELRWYADVTAAGRDSGWRYAAAVVVGACAGAVVLAVWTFSIRPSALEAATAAVLLAAVLAVGALCLLEGRRFEHQLAAAGRRSALGGVRRLEDALVRVQRATADLRAARRTWLRTRSATYPLAPQLAGYRHRAVRRAAAHRSRALAALARAVPVDLATLSVRTPDGYADGVRALTPLALSAPLDDDTWAAAVADLSRAAERDAPRRTRWLSALAACAELRDDPPARESAARWALEAAALPARTPGDPRTDPLPDTVAIEPTRPETWEGALRRARAINAGPVLLADATLRWAQSLAATADTAPTSRARARDAAATSPTAEAEARRTVAAATRAGGRTVAAGPGTTATARRATTGSTVGDQVTTEIPGEPVRSGSTAIDPDHPSGNELDPAVAAAAEVMTETTDPDEYLSRVRPGFEALGATGAQLSRLVPQWHAPTPARTP